MMYDVIIIGSGPAGLTAAIYTTRANLKTLVIAGDRWGGQLMLTTIVENFPGFPDGIGGSELMTRMRKQAEKYGAEIIEKNFIRGDFRTPSFSVYTEEKTYKGKSVIIATGSDTKWLEVPGEKEKIGHGVSSCAPCDAMFFRERHVIVAGGGDTAMGEAIALTKFAKHVTVVHRRDRFRASSIMQQKAQMNKKISFLLNSQIMEVLGDQKVEGVRLESRIKNSPKGTSPTRGLSTSRGRFLEAAQELRKIINLKRGKVISEDRDRIIWEMLIDGIFVAIGNMPNSKVFQGITVDKHGYIVVADHTKTNIDGVFVAGDVHDAKYSQAITAAGFGCAAAFEVQWWLEKMEPIDSG